MIWNECVRLLPHQFCIVHITVNAGAAAERTLRPIIDLEYGLKSDYRYEYCILHIISVLGCKDLCLWMSLFTVDKIILFILLLGVVDLPFSSLFVGVYSTFMAD